MAFCDYAVKLTLAPAKMEPADIDKLRGVGLEDPQISLGTQVISYFNYINRIAQGLGVQLEPWMTMSEEEWKSKKAVFQYPADVAK